MIMGMNYKRQCCLDLAPLSPQKPLVLQRLFI